MTMILIGFGNAITYLAIALMLTKTAKRIRKLELMAKQMRKNS